VIVLFLTFPIHSVAFDFQNPRFITDDPLGLDGVIWDDAMIFLYFLEIRIPHDGQSPEI
jgi:hypothetical protein